MTGLKLDNHPCFNKKNASCSGRIHLPVAPKCNIQCKYCNRKFDCANETRPGVTSRILAPLQALEYLKHVVGRNPAISVVGIAGPGDPMANPEETLETLRLVRQTYPDMLLCLSTNGLNLADYVDDLAALKVTHVTVTRNTTRAETAARIYSWMRVGRRLRNPREGAPILLERQLEAMKLVKAKGMLLKVNSILLPGVNEADIVEVAREAGEIGADLFNVLPYYQTAGCAFSHLHEPDKAMLAGIQQEAGAYLPQMTHCARCRADAVGLLGRDQSKEFQAKLEECANMSVLPPITEPIPADRPYVAAASREGMLVNQHLGEALELSIYRFDGSTIKLVDRRRTPEPGTGNRRWLQLSQLLHDCRAVVSSGLGDTPKRILSASGVNIVTAEGLLDDVVTRIFTNQPLNHLVPRHAGCSGCGGPGTGCGA